MQVRTGTVARRTNVTQNIPAAHVLSFRHCEPRQMSVNGLNAVAVVDHHFASVPIPHSSLEDGTVCGCPYRLALGGGDVNSGVESAFPVKGIQPGAERAGYDPLHWPFRWRVRQIHSPAKRRRKPMSEVEAVRD